jgi:hypothetical protein
MRARLLVLLGSLFLSCSIDARAQAGKVPAGVILVKGAWPSASDSVTPLPEGGKIARNVYSNAYFGITYPLRAGWTQKYDAPPPSDSGYYVLAQIGPSDAYEGSERGTLLIAARDLFFATDPARSAPELIAHTKDNLSADYKVEQPPGEVRIAGRSFAALGYFSPVAGLHWYVLATQIRCHIVELVFTSSERQWIADAVRAMNDLTFTDGEVPICVKDYASGDNIIERVDAVLSQRRFNSIPVRVIIDERGKVRHIHFLSAFPEQATGLTAALRQWRFKPYVRGGQPVAVETGILFGRQPRIVSRAPK